MQEMMAREQAEALATLMKANRALERIFGIEEEKEEDNDERRISTHSGCAIGY